MEGDFSSSQGIAQLLNNYFGFKLLRQDVDTPPKDLLVNVTLAVCRDLGLNDNGIEQPAFMHNISADIDIILPTLPFTHTLKLMKEVFARLGVPDIGSADLVDPSPKRTRRLIKVLLENWVKQRSLMQKYDAIHQAYAKAIDDREVQKMELNSVKSQLNQLLLHAGCQEEQRALVHEEGRSAAQRKEAAERRQAAQKDNYQDLKLQLTALVATGEQLQCTTDQLKAAIQKTIAATESDPGLIREQQQEATDALARCRQQASTIVAEKERFKRRLEDGKQADRARASLKEGLQEGLQEWAVTKETVNAYETNKTGRTAKEAKYHAACKACEHFKEESAVTKECMDRERHKLLAKLEAQNKCNIQMMQQLQSTHQQEGRLQEEIGMRKLELQKELEGQKAKCEEVRALLHKKEEDTKRKTARIMSDFKKYHDKFRSTCKEVQDALKKG
ncbi:polyamine-modulated factor 1-binding protein 1-like [Ornithodoros turicata]|uniref:polyamine-modulated factor 1-binding protein 1-like n=1 Tax=Ornithodoros turicata TaxID=34597 RepID=UPI003138BBAF